MWARTLSAHVDVVELIVVGVTLGDGVGGSSAQSVVVGDVYVACELDCRSIGRTRDVLVARPRMNGDLPALVQTLAKS